MTTREAFKVNDMVYELYSPDNERTKCEILFFHGFQFGDSLESEIYLSTWKSGNLSSHEIWPMTWLPERFPWARILAIRYDSHVITTGARGRFDLHNITECLARNLVDAGVGKSTARPVIFVGHSFGGLVMKQLCFHVYYTETSSVSQQEKAQMKCLLESIKGLFFYGTPHRGMSPRYDIPMKNPSPLMEFVKVLSAGAARLHQDLENLRERYEWEVGGVGETKETCLACGKRRPLWLQIMLAGANLCSCGFTAVWHDNYSDFKDIVVEEGSARYGAQFRMVDADHISLCQPETRKSASYTLLINFVEQVTEMVQEPRNRPHSTRSLNTYAPLPDLEASIREALEEKDVVLLYGNPGSGKSTLARYIREYYSHSPHELRGRNKVATGSSRDDPLSEPRKCIVVFLECGSGADVGSKLSELFHSLGPMASSRLDYSSDQIDLITQEIRSVLKTQETLIILDDVWEQHFIKAFVADLAFDLHHQVKFLITSRISTLWNSSGRIEIPPVSLENAERILAAHAGFPHLELPSYLKVTVDRLIKRTECNPLALATVGSRICKSKNEDPQEWIQVTKDYSSTIIGLGEGPDAHFTPVFELQAASKNSTPRSRKSGDI